MMMRHENHIHGHRYDSSGVVKRLYGPIRPGFAPAGRDTVSSHKHQMVVNFMFVFFWVKFWLSAQSEKCIQVFVFLQNIFLMILMIFSQYSHFHNLIRNFNIFFTITSIVEIIIVIFYLPRFICQVESICEVRICCVYCPGALFS